MKTLYYVCILMLFFQNTFSQNQLQGYDPFPTHGGANDITYNIAFDSQNRPWIGSGYVNGNPRHIAWFDGVTWDSIQAPPLIYNSFREAEFDHNGTLWLGGGYYVASYDNGNWNVFNGPLIGLPDTSFNVSGIVVDQQNKKWFLTVGTVNHYLVSYDGSTFTNFNITQLANDSTNYFGNGLLIDASNNIYITSPRADSMLVFNGTSFSSFNFFGLTKPAGYSIITSCFDPLNNNFWVAMANNSDSVILGRYSSGTWQFTSAYYPVSPLLFTSITVDPFGKVWLCDGNALVNFDGISWTSWPINLGFGVYDFTSDNLGNVWMGVQGTLNVYRFLASPLQSIQGTVWYDVNMDGVIDSSESGMPGLIVNQQPDNWVSLTSSNGNYQLAYSDSLQTYNVSVIPPLYWVQTIPASSTTVNPSSQSTSGINFGVAPLPGITDMRIFASASNIRPGSNSIVYLNYCNAGTDTISDTITYTFDPLLTFINSLPPPDVINGNIIQWAFHNLLPLSGGAIQVFLHLDSAAVIGDTLYSMASIGPLATDSVPTDNESRVVQTVRGSFDPNEKVVYPEGQVHPGDRLFYTIFFQNTGTDTAFSVIIRDTLDNNLNAASFRIEGSSDHVTSTITSEHGLEFRFPDIQLPDSNVNEPISHGFITYSIEAKNSLISGTDIKNTASIFFDFNSSVITNTTHSLIALPSQVQKINDSGFLLFPNPAFDGISIVTIKSGNWKVSVRNILGEEVFKDNFSGAYHRLDLKNISPGFYLINIYDKEYFLSEKFLKQ